MGAITRRPHAGTPKSCLSPISRLSSKISSVFTLSPRGGFLAADEMPPGFCGLAGTLMSSELMDRRKPLHCWAHEGYKSQRSTILMQTAAHHVHQVQSDSRAARSNTGASRSLAHCSLRGGKENYFEKETRSDYGSGLGLWSRFRTSAGGTWTSGDRSRAA